LAAPPESAPPGGAPEYADAPATAGVPPPPAVVIEGSLPLEQATKHPIATKRSGQSMRDELER